MDNQKMDQTIFPKLLLNDFFHGPDTLYTREFMKYLRREPLTPMDEFRKELDKWAEERERILRGEN